MTMAALTDGTTYTITAKVIDIAGNASSASTSTTVIVDTTAPTCTIADNTTGTASGAVTYTFTFSEDVGTSFDINDITVSDAGVKVHLQK